MKFITNVTILGLGRGAEFDTELTEYVATLVRSKMISIQKKAEAPAPPARTTSAPRKRVSEPRKRTSGTGTRKRAAKKAEGVSDVV